MGTPEGRILSHLLAGCLLAALLVLTPASAAAQTWRAERDRIQNEVARLVEKAAQAGETDISSLEEEFRRLEEEYLTKVVTPALAEARTCRQRMEAVEVALDMERQAQLFGSSVLSDAQFAELLTGAYANQVFERCMNELYRACVVEDNPLYAVTMVAWKIQWERQKQLLGGGTRDPIDMNRELDPRITKCRGPWYQVRIVVERSGTEPDLGPWHDKDVSEGWLGRGLTRRSPAGTRQPGEFTRRAEQLGYGARCPDGGCPESCAFTAVIDRPARVEYELEVSHAYRMLHIGFWNWDGEEKLEKNSCPHTDLPISLYPGRTFTATFPADPVAPLTEDPQRPGGADPKLTDAIDEWPRMFGAKGVELEVFGEPIGRLEVQRVCDGQEIWNRGAAECQQKWQEYLKVFGRQAPAAPWQRTPPRR